MISIPRDEAARVYATLIPNFHADPRGRYRQRQHDAITRFLAQFSANDWRDAQANVLPVADGWNSLFGDEGGMSEFVSNHMFCDIDAAMREVLHRRRPDLLADWQQLQKTLGFHGEPT